MWYFIVSHLKKWCEWRDLNPYVVRHTPLKRACLPVPAHSHFQLSASRLALSDKNYYISVFRICQHNIPIFSKNFWDRFTGRVFTFPARIPCRALRPKPHLQTQSVGNHRDKLTVCRFALDARDRVAEIALQGFEVAAIKMSDFCNKKLAVINCKMKSLLGWCAIVYWVKCIPF